MGEESEKKNRDKRKEAQVGRDIDVSYYSSVPNKRRGPGVEQNNFPLIWHCHYI